MMSVGIIFGVLTGVCISVCYLFSRSYQLGRPNGLAKLMVISHLVQGVVSAVLLLVLWREDIPPLEEYWRPMLGYTVSYLIGHTGLFAAIRYADASRVSPLLGFKVVILALIAVGFAGQTLVFRQWVAVVMTVAGVLVLNYSGGQMPWRALVGVVVACVAYSISDLFVRAHIEALAPLPPIWAGVFVTFMAYVCCGAFALAFLPWLGSRKLDDWRASIPYTAVWFIAQLLLFVSIALIGVVLMNICQATRAIWSVVLGAMVAGWGLQHLEQQTTRSVFVRRIAAAVMIVAAIGLYSSAKTEEPEVDATPATDAAAMEAAAAGTR